MTGKVEVVGAGPEGDGFSGHMTSGSTIQVTNVAKERQ